MFLNQYTVNETKQLIAAKDIEMTGLAKGRAKLGRSPDPTWDQDFEKLSDNYKVARAAAIVIITAESASTPLVPNDILTSDTAYHIVLDSLAHPKDGASYSTGDLQDLYNRLANVLPMESYTLPQPTTDIDLSVYKGAKGATDAITPSNKTLWYVGGAAAALLGIAVLTRR